MNKTYRIFLIICTLIVLTLWFFLEKLTYERYKQIEALIRVGYETEIPPL